jgi:hypothetical protein
LLLLSFSADPTYPQQIIYNQYTITPYLKNQLKTILGKKNTLTMSISFIRAFKIRNEFTKQKDYYLA